MTGQGRSIASVASPFSSHATSLCRVACHRSGHVMTSIAYAYQATDGAAYEVFLGRRSRRLAEKLLDFAAFGDDGVLLDVGCGTGSLTGAMAARWPQRRIIGVDFS